MLLALSLAAWPALVLAALRVRVSASSWLVWLGDRSYAIYLLNIPIIFFVAYSTGGLAEDRTSMILAQVLLVIANLAAADLVYRNFELPARRVIRLFFDRQSAVPTTLAS
jgi:peptidoglycan/LPS O-acetylase OafA/YrhL